MDRRVRFPCASATYDAADDVASVWGEFAALVSLERSPTRPRIDESPRTELELERQNQLSIAALSWQSPRRLIPAGDAGSRSTF